MYQCSVGARIIYKQASATQEANSVSMHVHVRTCRSTININDYIYNI